MKGYLFTIPSGLSMIPRETLGKVGIQVNHLKMVKVQLKAWIIRQEYPSWVFIEHDIKLANSRSEFEFVYLVCPREIEGLIKAQVKLFLGSLIYSSAAAATLSYPACYPG